MSPNDLGLVWGLALGSSGRDREELVGVLWVVSGRLGEEGR